MKAVILAAGVGKRLWPVTQHRPKCLIEIGGQTLLSRYLSSLASVGVQRADIVVQLIRCARPVSGERTVPSRQHFLSLGGAHGHG